MGEILWPSDDSSYLQLHVLLKKSHNFSAKFPIEAAVLSKKKTVITAVQNVVTPLYKIEQNSFKNPEKK